MARASVNMFRGCRLNGHTRLRNISTMKPPSNTPAPTEPTDPEFVNGTLRVSKWVFYNTISPAFPPPMPMPGLGFFGNFTLFPDKLFKTVLRIAFFWHFFLQCYDFQQTLHASVSLFIGNLVGFWQRCAANASLLRMLSTFILPPPMGSCNHPGNYGKSSGDLVPPKLSYAFAYKWEGFAESRPTEVGYRNLSAVLVGDETSEIHSKSAQRGDGSTVQRGCQHSTRPID